MKQLKKSFELTNTTLSSEFVSINFAINRVVSEDILCVKIFQLLITLLWMDLLLKQDDAGQTLKIKELFLLVIKIKVVMSYLKK